MLGCHIYYLYIGEIIGLDKHHPKYIADLNKNSQRFRLMGFRLIEKWTKNSTTNNAERQIN